MARATKILNKYEIKMLALSDRDINYDNFYKEELIAFCKCLKEEYKKQKKVIDRQKYLLKEQGAELKELYSEIDKLQRRIDKAIEYLEEPNRDSFDYSKAKLLDILEEVSE